MILNTEPYRAAIARYLAAHGLAPARGMRLHSHLPLGFFARLALIRVQRHMKAARKHPLVKINGLLDKWTREALIPPFSGPTAPQHQGGHSACTNATFAGLDQGVDFTGKGNVYALADCVITRIEYNTGWPGAGGPGTGTIIVYRMTSGPRSGQFVYIAEAINPARGLKVGDRVAKGALLGWLNSSYPGIETGFAQSAAGDAFGSTQDGKPGGPDPVHGREMEAFIKQVSA